MSALYFLIPLTLLMLAGAVAVFLWSVRKGQYEDFDGPANRVIIDDREERSRFDKE